MFGRVTTPYPLWDGTNRVLRRLPALRGDARRRRHALRQPDAPRSVARLEDDTMTRDAARRRRGAGQRAGRRTRSTCTTRPADLADRRRAAARLHVHRPGRAAGRAPSRPRSSRPPSTPTLAAQRQGADRGAQRLRHRRPRAHGRDHADRRRPAARLHASASPRRAPLDAMDTRAQVADLVRMKDPADAAYGCAPARFVRATRAVAPPAA